MGTGRCGRVRLHGVQWPDTETACLAPSDPVSPQMACTVMLRYLEQDGWTYDTACEKAAELGLAPAGSLEGDAITRGIWLSC